MSMSLIEWLRINMIIGIDARMINATGIGRYTLNLINELSLIDNINNYVIFLKKADFDLIKIKNKKFKKIVADFHWYGISEQVKFSKLIKANKIDLMHFPHFNVPFFYKGKFVVTVHDLTLHKYKTRKASTKNYFIYYIKHFLYKIIFNKAIRKSKYIITLSKFTKDDVLANFKIDKSKFFVTLAGAPKVIQGSSVLDSRVKNMFNTKDKFFLYVGNAYPHKNLSIFIDIAKQLDSNTKIVLAGRKDYFYNIFENRIKELDLQNKIILTDYVTDSELLWLYKNAVALIFPSFNEGFGLPLLEAASFGTPIITSNTSSLPEIIGDAALYFDPQYPDQAIDKINQLKNNNILRNDLIARGYDRIKLFSWRDMAKDTLKVYEKANNS